MQLIESIDWIIAFVILTSPYWIWLIGLHFWFQFLDFICD